MSGQTAAIIALFPELEVERQELEARQLAQIGKQFLDESKNTAERMRWVFTRWREIHETPRARLDFQREKVIRDRLRDGYSPEELELALYGCRFSAWNMGDNPSGGVYNSITLILRSADQVDRFIQIAEKVVAGMKRREEQRQIDPVKDSAPRADGAGYRTFLEQAAQLGVKVRK